MTLFKIYTILLAGVVISSASSILIRLAGPVPFPVIAFYRLSISMAVLLLYRFLRRTNENPFLGTFHWRYLLAGLFLALHFITWIASLQMTTIANSIFLESTHPLFAVICSALFLKEYPRRSALPLFLIAAGGMLVIVHSDFALSAGRIWGDLLAVSSAACVALYLMVARIHRASTDLITYLIVVYGAASAFCLFYIIPSGYPMSGFSGKSWLMIFLLALWPNLMGHSLFNWASRHLEIYKINLSLLLEPILATLGGMAFIHEFPPTHFYWGAVMILSSLGIYLCLDK